MHPRQQSNLFFITSTTVLLLSLLLAIAQAEENHLPVAITSPQQGVICNKEEKICYDTFGVSIGLTKEIMGDEAADKLTRELSTVAEASFDRTNFNPAQGVSCHTLEKACYEGQTVMDFLSAALFGNEQGNYDSHALFDVTWAWDKSQYNNDTEVRVMDGRRYELIFQADGSLRIQADCNKVFASYLSKGKTLSITLGPSTRMACGPNTQDHQFLKDLDGVATWFLKKGMLYLDLKFDTGTMHFYRGVAKQ